jgi:hypothetical protein
LYNQNLIQINITVKNPNGRVNTKDFSKYISKEFGFNAQKIITKYNFITDSLMKNSHDNPINPVTGKPFRGVKRPIIDTKINLLDYISETSHLESCTWVYNDDNYTLDYSNFFNSPEFHIEITSKKKDEYLKHFSSDLKNSYSISDYLDDIFIYTPTVEQLNSATCKLNINIQFGRDGAAFDKRYVKKAKFDLIISDEFNEFVKSFEDNIIDLNLRADESFTQGYSLPISNQNIDCDNVKLTIKLKSVILSDGVVFHNE